jgi:pimeloyl-ACP methyl ester carboxylesterase
MSEEQMGGVTYRATGSGDVTLLFVHGYGCSLLDWDAQVSALSDEFRCIAIDLPGHGASPLPGRPGMAPLAEAINVVKDRAAGRRVVLVGHSLGTRLVIDAVLAEGDKVAGLVLIDGRYYDGTRDGIERRMTALIDEQGFPAFIQRNFAGMFTENADPTLKARVLAQAARLDADFGRALFLDAVLSDPVRGPETLGRLDVPVLLLQSTDIDDQRRLISLRPGASARYMRAVSEWVPGAEVEVVPGVGHFTMIEAADAVNDRIRSFARKVSTGTDLRG